MSVFREATKETTEVAPPAKPVENIGSPIETHAPELLATYSEDMGKPYVAQYLGVENVWSENPTLKNEVETIESFIKDQIKRGNVENNTKAGEKFLKEVEKKAQINPYESATNKISKLLAYIEFRRVVDN